MSTSPGALLPILVRGSATLSPEKEGCHSWMEGVGGGQVFQGFAFGQLFEVGVDWSIRFTICMVGESPDFDRIKGENENSILGDNPVLGFLTQLAKSSNWVQNLLPSL